MWLELWEREREKEREVSDETGKWGRRQMIYDLVFIHSFTYLLINSINYEIYKGIYLYTVRVV